jgi:hypothetical protein
LSILPRTIQITLWIPSARKAAEWNRQAPCAVDAHPFITDPNVDRRSEPLVPNQQYPEIEVLALNGTFSSWLAHSAIGWITINDAAAVGPDIDSSIKTRIAGDLQDEPPLMPIIVDSRPVARFIDGTKDTRLAAHGSGKVEGRIQMVRSSFAEAEGLDLVDASKTNEGNIARDPRRGRMIKTVESSQPKIARAVRRRIDLVLASAIVAAR